MYASWNWYAPSSVVRLVGSPAMCTDFAVAPCCSWTSGSGFIAMVIVAGGNWMTIGVESRCSFTAVSAAR